MLYIWCGVSPSSRGRDCCCLGVFHSITSSLFHLCGFVMCIFVLSYHCRWYWWQVHLCRCLHIEGHVCGVSCSLQHLWNFVTAEACHRSWSLMWIIRQLCCGLDAMLYTQRKAVCFFFPWGFSCICWVLNVAFPEMTRGKFRTSFNRNNLSPFPVYALTSYFFWLGTDPRRGSKKCGNSVFSDEI